MLEIKKENTITEMKNVFDELISRLDKVKERISELFLKIGKQREEKWKKTEQSIQGRTVGQLQKE